MAGGGQAAALAALRAACTAAPRSLCALGAPAYPGVRSVLAKHYVTSDVNPATLDPCCARKGRHVAKKQPAVRADLHLNNDAERDDGFNI
jgi:hypothetical protein